MPEPEWSEVDETHPMTKMLNGLVVSHRQICAEAGISPWDFCVMLANAQGIILGSSKDMPTDKAIERVRRLGEVATLRIHEERAPKTSDRVS